jgi:hypothetical protein
MNDEREEAAFARLLSEQLPAVPAAFAHPPAAGLLTGRARRRRQVLAGAALVAVTAMSFAALGPLRELAVSVTGAAPVVHVASEHPDIPADWVDGPPLPVTAVQVLPDGHTVRVGYLRATCANVTLTVAEYPKRITVGLTVRIVGPLQRCPPPKTRPATLSVRLDRPLDGRPVFDANTGRPAQVWRG